MDIILIRHGETIANSMKIFSPNSTDLTDKGISQMKNASNNLKKYKFDQVIISEYLRTKSSFDAMNINHEYTIDNRLNEFNYGILKGMSIDEATEKYSEVFSNWYKNNFEYKIPLGESIDELLIRVKEIYNELIKKDMDTLIITHDGVIRSFLCILFESKDLYYKFKLDNGALTIIRIEDNYPRLYKFNEI